MPNIVDIIITDLRDDLGQCEKSINDRDASAHQRPLCSSATMILSIPRSLSSTLTTNPLYYILFMFTWVDLAGHVYPHPKRHCHRRHGVRRLELQGVLPRRPRRHTGVHLGTLEANAEPGLQGEALDAPCGC